MYVVVNRLPLAKPFEDALLAKINSAFILEARTRPGFAAFNSSATPTPKPSSSSTSRRGRRRGEYRTSTPRRGSVSTSCPTSLVPSTRTVGELLAGGPA